MENLEGMREEIEVLRKSIEVQTKIAEYWEGRWKQEYAEKTELMNKYMDMKKVYEDIFEKLQNKFELIRSTTQIAIQDIPNTQIRGLEGSSHSAEGKRKGISGEQRTIEDRGKKKRNKGPIEKRLGDVKCNFCNKTHTGECWKKMGACLRCGGLGHQVRNCPKPQTRPW